MTLRKWEPVRDIEDLFDRYTRALGWPLIRGQELVSTGDWTPSVDIGETEGEFLIKAELPDVKKEDVVISVEHGVLTIRGERKQEKEEKGKKFHRIERSYGSFVRSFTLPENVESGKIKANYRDGLLELTIPKVVVEKPKAIQVPIE